MRKYLRIVLPIMLLVVVFGLAVVPEVSALTLQEGAEAAKCDGCPSDLFGETGAFRQITNTILYIVGVIAVIMLIIGGIRYVISGGDAKKVTDAKNTVLYAIIGLVIAVFAYAIVNFVITSLPHSDDDDNDETQTSLLIETTKGENSEFDFFGSGFLEPFYSSFHGGTSSPNIV